MPDPSRRSRRFVLPGYLRAAWQGGGLALLLAVFLALSCISLAAIERSVGIEHRDVFNALSGVSLAAGLLPLFLLGRFSFGYIVGVSFFGVITGFVWISYFSDLKYDHAQTRLSAIASLLMFLLPILFSDTIDAAADRVVAASHASGPGGRALACRGYPGVECLAAMNTSRSSASDDRSATGARAVATASRPVE